MREKVYHYGTMLVLLLALVIGMLGTAKADAAVPAKPSVSLTKRTKTTAAIKIKKKGKVSGYQVYMKSSKSGKYQLIMGMKTSTYTIKKLKANKTYYVKVRAFRTRGYHITFGKYSSVLKIKPYKKPEPSQTPEPSDSPEPSVSPGPSMDPNASASPEPSVGPDASSSPDSSAVPDASASPEASGTPQPA